MFVHLDVNAGHESVCLPYYAEIGKDLPGPNFSIPLKPCELHFPYEVEKNISHETLEVGC